MSQKHFYSVGLFGGKNFGDELICGSVIGRLRETYPDSIIYMMTQNTEISKNYTAVDAEYVKGFWPESDYYLNLGRHLQAVTKSDVVVVGGGGLISDHYGWNSVPRHCIDALWSILLGRRYVFAGLGVCDVHRWWLRQLAKFVCLNAAALYCRDTGSRERVRKLTGRTDIQVGPDLANMAKNTLTHKYEQRNYALMNIRENPPINTQKVTELVQELLKNVEMLVLFSSERADTTYYKRLVAIWGPEQQAAAKIVEPSSLEEGIRWIQQAGAVVAERLHVNIVAALAGKRLLTINYEEKVKQFIDMLANKPLICTLEQVGADQARRLLMSEVPAWSANPAELETQAKKLFDKTVETGLLRGTYKISQRFLAGIYLAILLPIGMLWCSAVSLKRRIFRKMSPP